MVVKRSERDVLEKTGTVRITCTLSECFDENGASLGVFFGFVEQELLGVALYQGLSRFDAAREEVGSVRPPDVTPVNCKVQE